MELELINKIRDFCKKRGVAYCAIFGSRASGKNKETSDLDLVLDTPVHGLKFVGLILDIEKLLGIKVDAITKDSMEHPRGIAGRYFKDSIKKSLKVIYEAER